MARSLKKGAFCDEHLMKKVEALNSANKKEIIKTLTRDQEITVKGKITDVGEVLGYYLDITEISID